MLAIKSLNINSCKGMFKNCTQLEKVSLLVPDVLINGCFNNMFENCSTLSNVEVTFLQWSGREYIEDKSRNARRNTRLYDKHYSCRQQYIER